MHCLNVLQGWSFTACFLNWPSSGGVSHTQFDFLLKVAGTFENADFEAHYSLSCWGNIMEILGKGFLFVTGRTHSKTPTPEEREVQSRLKWSFLD